jgi:NADP-dependent aldehyde dehydrogenase
VSSASPTSDAEVHALAEAADEACSALESLGRQGRAALLRDIADRIDAARDQLVEIGHRETAIPVERLRGEAIRTSYQARFFADVLEEGSYLEATIDHAGTTPMGPGPDLRKLLVPIGPVAVFGASNFPLAFSVLGGDTVSALAAGCPVVIKAHHSHPELSRASYELLRVAVDAAQLPEATVGLVHGTSAGARLVAERAIAAVGFTGSLGGGEALMRSIRDRPDPIPFYGELSSINPVIITPGAARARADEIAAGLVASVTTSAGQLCTKPGVVIVPRGEAGDDLLTRVIELTANEPARILLNERITHGYLDFVARAKSSAVPDLVMEGLPGEGVAATIFEIDAESVTPDLIEETFGPTTLVIRADPDQLAGVIDALPGSLTATVQGEPDEAELVRTLFDTLRPKAGRLLYGGFPTGVLVAWAQNHGGPWPATNTQYTSVGADSIRTGLAAAFGTPRC